MKDTDSPAPAANDEPSRARGFDRDVARRETRRFLKFLVVGAFGFVVDSGTLSVLALLLDVKRVVAKGIAFCLAVLCNFVWNRFWTYPESRTKSIAAQVTQFTLISLVGLAINLVVFGGVDALLSRSMGPVSSLYLAQVAAVGVALFWNFAANRIITYGDVRLGR
jgi:putative flippase GtrA